LWCLAFAARRFAFRACLLRVEAGTNATSVAGAALFSILAASAFGFAVCSAFSAS